jgi:tRNA uridine 5-carboxymethylaminomethyl modification enzyme
LSFKIYLYLYVSRESSASVFLVRPDIRFTALMQVAEFGPGLADPIAAEQVEIETKYAGYLDRQREDIARAERNNSTLIPEGFDYTEVRGLSSEVLQKLEKVRPESVGQAQRIPGLTPAAISLLLVHLTRVRRAHAA